MARCHHAPEFLASLIRHPWHESPEDKADTDDEDLGDDDDDEPPVIDIRRFEDDESMLNAHQTADADESTLRQSGPHDKPFSETLDRGVEVHITEVSSHTEEPTGEPPHKEKTPYFVLPLAAVLVSSSVGLLSFLGTSHINSSQTVRTLNPSYSFYLIHELRRPSTG